MASKLYGINATIIIFVFVLYVDDDGDNIPNQYIKIIIIIIIIIMIIIIKRKMIKSKSF